MKASKIASDMKQAGLPVGIVAEGTHDVDGMVQVTALVHVQVPTCGSKINVVAQSADGEEFEFYPERNESDIDGIADDIRKACGMSGADQPSNQVSKMTNLQAVQDFVRAEYSYDGVADPLTVANIAEITEADTRHGFGARAGDFWITDEVTGQIVRVVDGAVETVWRNW